MKSLFWQMVGLIVTIVIALAFTYWIYTATMASDLPDWIKYVILH